MPRQNWPITAIVQWKAHRDGARSIIEAIHAQATALMPNDPIHATN